MSKWHIVIGLEIHVQLKTKTKLFSSAPTAYGSAPNTQANRVDLALPGTLPVLNQGAMDMAIRFGLATNSTVNQTISFDRKNYFYPDLPKGYQITQHYQPILSGGYLDIPCGEDEKRIRLHHTHLEEDAGKSLHKYDDTKTGIDLNRAGTPLLEVVSEPDMRSTEEAVQFLKTLHNLVVSIGICDGNMQEGSFRCDANISLRPSSNAPFGSRVEIKNINSFRFVEKALMYEITRQSKLLDEGVEIRQQTRLYNEQTQKTHLMREKEQAHDYRYHTDPDIPIITISTDRIERVRANMPELPSERKTRYMQACQLSAYDATVLSSNHALSHYFDDIQKTSSADIKLVANWLLGPVSALMNKYGQAAYLDKTPAKDQAALLDMIHHETVSQSIAKTVLDHMWELNTPPKDIVKEKNLEQVTSPEIIASWIDQVFAVHAKQLNQYLAGQDKLYGFFVGKTMQLSKGKAMPERVNAILKQKLASKLSEDS